MNNFRRRVADSKINGYEFVDMGLPSGTLWAKCNVGATDETLVGNFYQYGAGSLVFQDTVNLSSDYYTGEENPLSFSKDTARVVMGDPWRMPTKTETEELVSNSTVSRVVINNIPFAQFTSNINGNILLFPMNGYYGDWDTSTASYWRANNSGSQSGSIRTSTPDGYVHAYRLSLYCVVNANRITAKVESYYRYYGFGVRGVVK